MKFLIGLLFSSCLFIFGQSTTVTYGDLGTFSDEYPWGGTNERPSHILPSTPESVNTRFYLDTRRRKGVEIYNTDMSNLKKTTFDKNKMTRIIIHGYTNNGDTAWLNEMSDAHLGQEDINSIRVGWVGGSLQLNYFQSATDTQIVGAETGLLIKNIIDSLGGDPKKFHCVGHSLGAHSCSYAGTYLQNRGYKSIARITGLDPAGPYFQSTPNEVRLEKSDADYVDAMHTDAEKLINLGYGINQQSGHIDFWPNDGVEQPGCDQNVLSTIWDPDGIVEGATNFVACNHMRSVAFYIESVSSSCPFYGYPCGSYSDYLSGQCTSCDRKGCVSMGYRADDGSNVHAWTSDFYLSTNWEDPYCEYMADVEVHTTSSSDDVEGRLFITLYGSNGNTEQVQLSDEDVSLHLLATRTYSYLAHFLTFPDNVSSIKLLWHQDEWTATSRHINVDTVTVHVGHLQQTLKFCGTSENMVEERRYEFDLC